MDQDRVELTAPRRGRLFQLLSPLTSYLVTNLTVTVFWVFFFVLNRTRVTGRHNVGAGRNTLLLVNHQSMLDSFLVGLAAYYPRSWLKPQLIPWNPAAAENFYKNPLLAWLADNWKCIWVRQGRHDLHALHRMMQVLPRGTMTLFPEGTRSRDGSVGSGRAGPGLLILATRPRVIPVAIEGMNDVLPIGRYVPRVFQRICVCFGPPVDYAEFVTLPRTRETAQRLIDSIMEQIRVQHADLAPRDGSAMNRVRLAQPTDVADLEALIARSARGLSVGYYTPAQTEAAVRYVFGVDSQLIADRTYFVIEHDGHIVACGGWSRRRTLFGGDQAKAGPDPLLDPTTEPARIRAFFVDPEMARRGLGRQLMSECIRAARAAGFSALELVSTLPGEPLYAATGFSVIERFDLALPGDILVPVTKMRRSL